MKKGTVKDWDKIKRKLEWVLKVFNTFYNVVTHGSVHQTVENSGNQIVQILHNITKEITGGVKDHKWYRQRPNNDHDRYRRLIINPAEMILAIYYSDSAWRDIGNAFLWRLKEEFKNNPELCEHLDNIVKDPDFYYFNIWEDFQQETLDLQKQGILQKGMMGNAESYLVDSEQKRRVEQHAKQKQQEEKKHKHW